MRKGYRLYDRAAHQVLHSRNVRFDEQESTVPTPENETGEEPAPAQRVLELDMSEANQEDEDFKPNSSFKFPSRYLRWLQQSMSV